MHGNDARLLLYAEVRGQKWVYSVSQTSKPVRPQNMANGGATRRGREEMQHKCGHSLRDGGLGVDAEI